MPNSATIRGQMGSVSSGCGFSFSPRRQLELWSARCGIQEQKAIFMASSLVAMSPYFSDISLGLFCLEATCQPLQVLRCSALHRQFRFCFQVLSAAFSQILQNMLF